MATIDKRDTVPIPQPKGLPFVGNVSSIDPELPTKSFMNLAAEYGEIYSLNILGSRKVFINNVALATEVCDEKRFHKDVAGGLKELRNGIQDGLFTAFHKEPNWEIAHRVLVPAFGPLPLHGMFDAMKDIASQLALKWARMGSQYRIPVADDFTRLTLDTLALCAMDYRFNSFYTEEMHPFIDAMTTFLKIGGSRARRPGFMAPFYRAEDAEFFKSIDFMRTIATDLVRERREHPKPENKDLLNAMVNGKDPKTGAMLPEENITSNMITFLIAGHETTSGLLSFLWYYMLKSPEAYRKAREEVDSVLGGRSIEFDDLNKLPWISAMLRETLRLQPTAPAFAVTPNSEHGEVIGGKYYVAAGEPIITPLHCLHRDPAVYGGDADEWKPERMLDENFNKLPAAAWKPFGNGARGCIGRPFAWQEALLVVATCLQFFDYSLDDPSYDLQLKSTLTIKPKDFFVRATLREGWNATKVEHALSGAIGSSALTHESAKVTTKLAEDEGIPITVLYGSNSGTCEAFAQTLAADAAAHGFRATVNTLDSVARQEPTTQPTVIITASYEGQPTDNAGHYFDWLSNLPEDKKIENSTYAVFAAGHSDWASTFHKVPTTIDRLLAQHGSSRICKMGSADAKKGDMMSEFQTWEDNILWPAMKKQFGGEAEGDNDVPVSLTTLDVEVSSRRASHLRADVSEAKVLAARTLTEPGVPERRHIELQLPSEATYRAGDYLAILPLNPQATVHRVAVRFGLAWDSVLTITSKTGTALPKGPIPAQSLFGAYLELSQPATKRNIALLIATATDADTKASLEILASDDKFGSEITEKRTSLLDLLDRFPSVPLPLAAFIASLITMRVRQYSISSSPLANPRVASLTYSIIDSPSHSGQGRYIGVASHYLSQLKPGDIVHVAVKPSAGAFHLPTDNENTPIIMVAAGTGLAPFRGFIQERAAQIGAGRKLAPAHLYIGCRHPAKDSLYSEEMTWFEKLGAVQIHHAYSQAPELSNGHKHVDDALRADGELLTELWAQGAKVYTCGSRGIGEGVKEIFMEQYERGAVKMGKSGDRKSAEEWFERVKGERYATDVFD
ncbi:hypothetical protein LTR95_000286 [Oleoguttula sp. CCFEE 5521]